MIRYEKVTMKTILKLLGSSGGFDTLRWFRYAPFGRYSTRRLNPSLTAVRRSQGLLLPWKGIKLIS